MTSPAQQPTPELIFGTFNAYQRTACLRAAIELEAFTAIGEGANTPAALASRCQASERGMRILCDFLVTCGLLVKNEGRYGLTPDSAAFLDRRSPAYLGGAVHFLNSSMLMDYFKDVAAVVRKGGTLVEGGTMAPDHPIWVEFARSMTPMMVPSAQGIAQLIDAGAGHKWKVLDIAAGHGSFGIAIAKQNPNAEIVALDWENVLAVAQENARAAGVADRFRTLPGSAFDVDYGSGYDIVLVTNFFHHFDVPTCGSLMGKIHRSLKPGGRVVTLEFVPNEDRVTPLAAAPFSMMMLASTPSGDAYTFAEYDAMFRNAGFSRSELHPLPMSPEQVIISHR